jgi:hypothetical protein
MKKCNNCNIEKENSYFNKKKDNKDGLRGDCRECQSIKRKEYYLKNEKKYKEPRDTSHDKLRKRIRASVLKGMSRIKDGKKSRSSSKIIGCSWSDFKLHIETQFKDGMTWDNHGDWHLDHIIPLSSAKTEEEVYKLNHYTNLQPLWAEENLKKGDKIFDFLTIE